MASKACELHSKDKIYRESKGMNFTKESYENDNEFSRHCVFKK
jgi:hypothetical protein